MNDDADGPDLSPEELTALLAQEPFTSEVFSEPVSTDDIRGDTLLPAAGREKYAAGDPNALPPDQKTAAVRALTIAAADPGVRAVSDLEGDQQRLEDSEPWPPPIGDDADPSPLDEQALDAAWGDHPRQYAAGGGPYPQPEGGPPRPGLKWNEKTARWTRDQTYEPAKDSAPHDWKSVPSTGKQPKWHHQDTGEIRRGNRPAERPEQDRKASADSVAAQLTAAPTVAASPSGRDPAKVSATMFGPDAPPDAAAKLLGLPTGSKVKAKEGTFGGLDLDIDHPYVTHWMRTVHPKPDGTLNIDNRLFLMKVRHQGNGFGLKAFSDQVRNGYAQGVGKINTTAGKGGSGGGKMNGYYTWARMGYDADLAPRFRSVLPPELKGAKTVQDLMSTPAGRSHWKDKGYMTDMTFDVSQGSRSLDTLNKYLAEKGLQPVGVSDEEHATREQAIRGRADRFKADAAAELEERKRTATARNPSPDQIEQMHKENGQYIAGTGLEDQVRQQVERDMSHPLGPTETYAGGLRNSYLYWTNELGRQRFVQAIHSPAGQQAAQQWHAIAEKEGVSPQELTQEINPSFRPDAADAVNAAYAQAMTRLRIARERKRAAEQLPATDGKNYAATRVASPKAAGLCVRAADTGRVLLIQRGLTDGDPAAGKWEFPGGHIDPGEDPETAAKREWHEETGSELPAGKRAGDWTSPNGVYRGFVHEIPEESAVTINPPHGDRHTVNPDDPDGDITEVAAWHHPADLPEMPGLREEAKQTPWNVIKGASGPGD